MNSIKILDCTLRDGGIVTDFYYGKSVIQSIIDGLFRANVDYIELGYLDSAAKRTEDYVVYNHIEEMEDIIPKDRKGIHFVAMCDVGKFNLDEIKPRKTEYIDGVRIAFYKHQIADAVHTAKVFRANGYKIYIQPMVTGSYREDEFVAMCKQFLHLKPEGFSIVDSFGYMDIKMFQFYYAILSELLAPETLMFFHSHNNTNQSLTVAQYILSNVHDHDFVIDASLMGFGKCAGNLHTEHLVKAYNTTLGGCYNLDGIHDTIARYIAPLKEKYSWGPNFYNYMTAINYMHANYATFYLECAKKDEKCNHEEMAVDFIKFIQTIPSDMKTTCNRKYVQEMYEVFRRGRY